jgi:membrane protein DedA with SNARE-associated domain
MLPALDADFLAGPLSAVLLAIVVSAILQDDFTCLAVGMYIAAGDLAPVPALLACFVGTLLGDFFWFLSGRLFGIGCLERPPIKWVVSQEHLARAREFCEKHGAAAVLWTRFMPVIRTPVQVAAGVFTTRVSTCLFCLTIAALVYAPLFVLGSALVANAVNVYSLYEQYGPVSLLGVTLAVWTLLVAIRFAVRKGRHRLVAENSAGPRDLE